MDLFDAIVVGSGPAGTMCAYALRGSRVLVLDVGRRPPGGNPLSGNLYRLRQSGGDLFEPLIGKAFESLHNIHRRPVSLKLKAPFTSYVIEGWEGLAPIHTKDFEPVISLAEGGLANAWGAGVYRFRPQELLDYPIRLADLEPFYDELTKLIGVSGANDDLAVFFGQDADLLAPLRLSSFFERLLAKYKGNKGCLNDQGVFIGYPRLAVLTRPHGGRGAYTYDNLEFFKSYNPAIYNPAFTMEEMVGAGEIDYIRGFLVTRYSETAEHIEVFAKSVDDGNHRAFRCKSLFLAAGALNSARIVLQSHEDYKTHLPILDNPMACLPIFDLRRIGAPLETEEGSLAQLNLVYEDRESGLTLQGTLYGTTGPLRSDVLFQFPLTASANLTCAKYISPAMGLLMMFSPCERDPNNYLKLRPDGSLEIEYGTKPSAVIEKSVVRALRRMGYLCSSKLCQYPPMGSGLHYAGTLPMRQSPGSYEVASNGLLCGTRAVYVVDGACLPSLPAKNLTFTVMANAMRIGSLARRSFD